MVEKTTTNTKFWKMKNSGRRLVIDSAQQGSRKLSGRKGGEYKKIICLMKPQAGVCKN